MISEKCGRIFRITIFTADDAERWGFRCSAALATEWWGNAINIKGLGGGEAAPQPHLPLGYPHHSAGHRLAESRPSHLAACDDGVGCIPVLPIPAGLRLAMTDRHGADGMECFGEKNAENATGCNDGQGSPSGLPVSVAPARMYPPGGFRRRDDRRPQACGEKKGLSSAGYPLTAIFNDCVEKGGGVHQIIR